MSTLKVINSIHPSGSTNNLVFDSSGNTTAGGTLAMSSSFLRNRIINGDMRIDQRNAGAAVTISGAGQVQYVMDRFFHYNNTGTTYTAQQSTDAPTNFSNSALASFGASVSPAAGTDGAHITQVIEGFNIADLNWGTANAQSITLSFWAKSGLTGSHGLSLMTYYSGGTTTIGYPVLYTINAANTWEYKTITIPGPTTGTWNTTNGAGLFIRWYFCAGSNFTKTPNAWAINTGSYGSANSIYGHAPIGMTNLFQSGNTFRVTGVQLEVGTVATPFERRLYGQELVLCQRYYTIVGGNLVGMLNGSGTATAFAYLPANPRTTPSVSYTGTAQIVVFGVNTYSSTTQPSSISCAGNNLLFAINGFGSTPASGSGQVANTIFNASMEL